MDLLNRILLLIESKGVEQQEFARALGVSKQTISDWKSGKNKSYTKYTQQIADYFNVSSDYLLGIEKITVNDPDGNPLAIDRDTMDIIKLITGNPELKAEIIANKDAEPEDLVRAFKAMKIFLDGQGHK